MPDERDDTTTHPPPRGLRALRRREALAALGTVTLGSVLAACGGDDEPRGATTSEITRTDGATATVEPKTRTSRATAELFEEAGSCAVTPELTEGPYYFDVDSIRSDITEDREGTPLRLALRVRDTGSCEPIENAVVDVWHIHVKVHLDRTTVLTSQLFFDDAFTDTVYARPPYSETGARDVLNDSDGIFAEEGLLTLRRGGRRRARAAQPGRPAQLSVPSVRLRELVDVSAAVAATPARGEKTAALAGAARPRRARTRSPSRSPSSRGA